MREKTLRRLCNATITAATRVSNRTAKRASERAFEVLGKLEIERDWERGRCVRDFLGPDTVDADAIATQQLEPEDCFGRDDIRLRLYEWARARGTWFEGGDVWRAFCGVLTARVAIGPHLHSLEARGLLEQRRQRKHKQYRWIEVDNAEAIARLNTTAARGNRHSGSGAPRADQYG